MLPELLRFTLTEDHNTYRRFVHGVDYTHQTNDHAMNITDRTSADINSLLNNVFSELNRNSLDINVFRG